MSDLLLRIQDAALQLNPSVLWIPGLVAAFLGLFLWLGGKRYSFFVIGILGAALGAAIGLIVSQWFGTDLLVSVAIGAILIAIAAVLMERLVIVLLATLIFATACGSSYWSYAVKDTDWKNKLSIAKLDQARGILEGIQDGELPESAFDESVTTDADQVRGHQSAVAKLKEIFAAIKTSAGENKGMLILWTILGAAIGLTLAYLLKKLVMAFCCSVVGSASIIAGIIAVILAKGNMIISTLLQSPKLVPTIFLAMVFFGFACQLLFGRKPKKIVVEEEDD